jgi:hypothetical protein
MSLTTAPRAGYLFVPIGSDTQSGVKRLIRLSFYINLLLVVGVGNIHIVGLRLPASEFRLQNFTLG